jgi:hypothetical protein
MDCSNLFYLLLSFYINNMLYDVTASAAVTLRIIRILRAYMPRFLREREKGTLSLSSN